VAEVAPLRGRELCDRRGQRKIDGIANHRVQRGVFGGGDFLVPVVAGPLPVPALEEAVEEVLG
jgi:hypothetical protein